MRTLRAISGGPASIAVTLGLIAIVLWLNSIHYLLFHTVSEVFSTIIACCLFIISWNTRKISENQFISFLGIGFLFVGLIDMSHALAYQGMNLIPTQGANEATQLWIGARTMQAASLLIAPVFITKYFHYYRTVLIYMVVTVIILASIFLFHIFPDCYLSPMGQTPFKKNAELLIIAMLIAAVFHLHWQRRHIDGEIAILLNGAILVTLASEIAFTIYVGVYDVLNQIGHLLKIISFILIYRATVAMTLAQPLQSMFSQLSQSEDAQKKLIDDLQHALSHVRQLQEFLPICANCKKIRNDQGYWLQIESYISEHTDTQFSHSICPECTQKLYPDIAHNLIHTEKSH